MRYCFVILLFCLCSRLEAQVRSPLSGTVKDTSGAVLEGLTVSLQAGHDSSILFNVRTNAHGKFHFESIPVKKYLLKITGTGFLDLVLKDVEPGNSEVLDFTMETISPQMEEVVVVAEKPLFEDKDGVLTMNVSASPAANSSSAGELLKNMPMMASDPDGKLLLKGKEPRILIDDKPTGLNAQQLADLLESLPGSAIEKIEMMMNPPPQYASEEGGVINIVTKKGKIGFTGRLNSFYGTRGEINLNGNFSYRDKKWAVDFIAGNSLTQTPGSSQSRRENFYTDSTSQLLTNGRFSNSQWRPHFRLSGDYEINPSHRFNLVVQGQYADLDNLSLTAYRNVNRFDEVYRLNTRANGTLGSNVTPGATASYIFKGKNPAQQLKLIAGINGGSYDNTRIATQRFLSPKDETTIAPDSIQQQLTNNGSRSLNIRADYTHPSGWKPLTFSTGFTFLNSRNNNKLDVSYTNRDNGAQVPIPHMGNDFVFLQQVLGYRGSVIFRFNKKWQVNGGTTFEQTAMRFRFFTGNTPPTTNRYGNLLPQATLRKEWSGNRTATLSYRKTVRRPGIRELNPTVDEYTDPYNIRFGNPFLAPALAHNYDLTLGKYKGKSYVNFSLGYNKVEDIIQQMRTAIPGEKTQITFENLAGRKEYEAGLWGGYTFSRKFRLNTSIHYLFSEYLNDARSSIRYRNGGSLNASMNWTYTFNPLFLVEGSSRYHSFADPQGRSRANLSMQLGLQQKLLNKRMTISMMVVDPFRQQQFKSVTYNEKFTVTSERYSRTQNLRIGLAYNLTPAPKQVSQKQINDAVKKVKGS